MAHLNPERFRQIERLYHSTLDCKEVDRAAHLRQACAGDDELLREVESLLSPREDSESFFEGLAGREASKVLGDSSDLPPPIGGFEIIRKLGSGGMGDVYLARQASLERLVALKLLSPALAHNPGSLQRFLRESKIAGGLHHPSLVSIYESGVEAGRPYIAMRYVEGETLAEKIAAMSRSGVGVRAGSPARGELSRAIRVIDALDSRMEPQSNPEEPGALTSAPSERKNILRLVLFIERAAMALHVAHEAGLIHRDIKPGNIMATKGGDPVILDFGLARLAESDGHTLTQSGDVLGTPAYMSPEQLARSGVTLDRRTDVYSLGVTLFECLTLHRPFDGPTREALYQGIISKDPSNPRRLNPQVPRDLKVVLETALEKDRDRRYQTALDLAEDLRRVREYEPIRARPAGPILRFRRWTQRNPRVATATISAFVILSGALLVSLALLAQLREETAAKGKAIAAKDQALTEKEEALHKARTEQDAKAQALVHLQTQRLAAESLANSERDPGLALLLALEASKFEPGLAVNNAAVAALQSIHESLILRHGSFVEDAALSPDGARIVTASSDFGWIWDAVTGEPRTLLSGHHGAVRSTQFSPDSSRVVTASDDGTAKVWDAGSGKEILTLVGHASVVCFAAFSPDGRRIVTASTDGNAVIWDALKGEPLTTLGGHPGGVASASFSPDGERVLTAGLDGSARIWKAAGPECLLTLKGHDKSLMDASFSPDGRRVVTAGWLGTARIWDASSGIELLALTGHSAPVGAAAFSPSGHWVVTASEYTARVWDAQTGKQLPLRLGHKAEIHAASFSSDGGRIITAGADGAVTIWSMSNELKTVQLEASGEICYPASFSPDGQRIVSGGWDNTAAVFDTRTGKSCFSLRGHRAGLRSVSFSSDGLRIITSSEDGTARVWSASNGDALVTLAGHESRVLGANFSPDGRRVVTGSYDLTARIWDSRTGEALKVLRGHTQEMGASFSPDGRRVLTTSCDTTARIWDAETGKELCQFKGHSGWVLSGSFSPDGGRVVTGSTDNTARIWDAGSGKELWVLKGHDNSIQCVAFSPDGRKVATASADKTTRIWDAFNGEEIVTLSLAEPTMVMTVVFSNDGKHVRTMDLTGTAAEWPVDVLKAALARKSRELTPDEQDRYKIGSAEDRTAYRKAWDSRIKLTLLELESRRQKAGSDDAAAR